LPGGLNSPLRRLLVLGPHDEQVLTARLQTLSLILGLPQKCALTSHAPSHNANLGEHLSLLLRASLDWLTDGWVNGIKQGALKLGY